MIFISNARMTFWKASAYLFIFIKMSIVEHLLLTLEATASFNNLFVKEGGGMRDVWSMHVYLTDRFLIYYIYLIVSVYI